MQGRRERKKQETRAAMLSAALELFHENGIVATRVEHITDRVDVAKGVFYNYFSSKDEIVYALVVDGVEILRGMFSKNLNARWSLKRRVEAIVQTHERFFLEYPNYAVLFQQARGLLETKSTEVALLRKGFQAYLEVVADRLFSANLRKTMPEDQALQFASALAGAIGGYRSFRLVCQKPFDFQIIQELMTKGLVNTIQNT